MTVASNRTDGFYNLLIIISTLSIIKFFIEDYIEFGFLMKIPFLDFSIHDIIFSAFSLLLYCLRSSISYFIVNLSIIYTFINFLIFESIIIYVNLMYIKNIYLAGGLLILNLILIAKLVSFHIFYTSCNKVLKEEKSLKNQIVHEKRNLECKPTFINSELDQKNNRNLDDTIDQKIPFINLSNITDRAGNYVDSLENHTLLDQEFLIENNDIKKCTFLHFVYFNIIPTLCYLQKYPMTESRNCKKILYRFFSLIISLLIFIFVTDQYSIPSIYRIIKCDNFWIVVENAINLSLSTAILFLIFFHIVFVCCLNILAEITRFKNIHFYQAWWNSTTVRQFWTLWNIPVHLWIKKHIYIPLRKRSLSRNQALVCSFLISAIVHEYVLSVCTKNFCGYVFLGMMAQIPLIYISDKINKLCPILSNFFFWGSFSIIGHPIIVILYYRSKELSKLNFMRNHK